MASNLSLGRVFIEIGVKKDKSLQDAPREVDKLKKSTGGLVSSLGVLKGAMAGIGIAAFIGFLRKAVDAQSEQITAMNQLNLALANQGNLVAGSSKRMNDFASSIQATTAFGDELVLQAAALGASFGMNEDQLRATTTAALDFAAATGRDLTSAMNLLGKAFVGETGELSRYGIVIDKNIPKSEKFAAVMQQMTERFGGSAQAQVKTLSGFLTQLGNAVGDVFEQIGKLVGFIVGEGGSGFEVLISIVQRIGKFFGEDLVITIGFVRAAFMDFIAGVVSGLAGFLDKLSGIPVIGERFKGASQGLRDFADSMAFGAEQTRIQALEAAKSVGVLQEYENNTRGAGKATSELSEEQKRAAKEAAEYAKFLDQLTNRFDAMAESITRNKIALNEFRAGVRAAINEDIPASTDIPEGAISLLPGLPGSVGGIIPGVVAGVGDVEDAINKAKERQEAFNDAIEHARNLFELIPGPIGQITSGLVGGAAALKNLTAGGKGLFGGLKGAFSAGKGDQTGIMGLIGGIGGLAEAVGPLIGIGQQIGKAIFGGIKKLFGAGGPNLVRDAARDLGATISKELADSIKKSGRPIQLAVAQIFQEGGFASVDIFAREIGDIFSVFEQGKISKPEAITALEQSVPLLLQNLKELGPEGEAEIQRIIAAAERLGIEFNGLGELMQSTFAPQTMEQIAAGFGLTNDQVRAMADTLGIDIQTDLERIAASVGLTAAEFQELGAAMEQEFGIPAEQLSEFLEATGLSAAELAQSLGVEVGEGAQTVADAQAQANVEIGAGVDAANQLANALERAARASGGIHIPSGDNLNVPGAAHGAFVRSSPGGSLVRVGEGREDEAILPLSKLASMMRERGGFTGGRGEKRAGSNVTNVNLPMPQFADRAFEQHFVNRVLPELVRKLEQNSRGNTQSIAKVLARRRRA